MTRTKTKLGDIFHMARGGSPRPIKNYITNQDDGIPWIMIGDTNPNEKFISSTKKKIIPDGLKKSRMVFPGDFLLTNSMSFGRPYILQIQGCIHDGWLVLSPKKENVSRDYFYHLLGSDNLYREFSRQAAGATVKNLNIELVSNVEVYLPPLPEQKRIAAILDQADALRRQRQRALDQLNQLGQSIFYEMFLDGRNYKKRDLIDCVEGVQIGPFGSLLHQADYIENGIPLVNPKHINGGNIEPQAKVTVTKSKYEELNRYHMRTGDIVMARRGEMGRCAVVDEEANGYLCGTGSLFIRSNLDIIRPFFLQRFLSSPRTIQILENEASGVTMLNLNAKALKALSVPVPPIEKQIEFEDKVSERSGLFSSMELNFLKLESLFASLQQRAFRGEL